MRSLSFFTSKQECFAVTLIYTGKVLQGVIQSGIEVGNCRYEKLRHSVQWSNIFIRIDLQRKNYKLTEN